MSDYSHYNRGHTDGYESGLKDGRAQGLAEAGKVIHALAAQLRKHERRAVRANAYGNIHGYIGNRKVHEFGTNAQSAHEWLKTGEWLGMARDGAASGLLSINPVDQTILRRPYVKGWYNGTYDTKGA